MKKVLFLLLITVLVGGCANKKTPYDTDLRNSPCACNYSGEQLITNPTDEQLKRIADLQFS